MLDPLSALGVASNIVQLVGFTAEIVKESRAYVKGQKETIPSYETISELVERQQAAFNNVNAIEFPVGPLDRDEQHVKDLAERCVEEGRKLISILETLALAKKKIGPAMLAVLKSKWKRSDAEQHRQVLANYQDQLSLALMNLIRRDQRSHFAALHELIEFRSHSGHSRILDVRDSILETIEQQRQIVETAQRQTAARLAQLSSSVIDSRDMLLTHQTESRDAILREFKAHKQQNMDSSDKSTIALTGLDHDLQHIRSLLIWKERRVERIKITNEQRKKLSRILSSLACPDMRLRHDTIVEAHPKTFEWIFEDRNSAFAKWLRGAGDMFWVNGKAGSGKSTLMKFLARDPRTKTLLRAWGGHSPVITVDLYFWYAGSRLQNSEEGLLRSILYRILCRCPELLPIVMLRRWNNSKAQDDSWSLRELREAVMDIASFDQSAALDPRHSQGPGPKFCFVIDGLDEYHADHLRLVELLQTLSKNDAIKICVSSRPWNVFEQAFGDLQDQLVLQNLTREDISLFVQDKLRLPHPDAVGMKALAREVAAKAQGVFLWVYLAVRSLREGIAEGDDVFLLRERLAQLPPDLGDYFHLILSRVHPVYKKSKTMTALHMAVAATRAELEDNSSPATVTRSFVNFWILRQGIDDPGFAIRQAAVHLYPDSCEQFGRRTRTFLNAICKDLLYLPMPREGYTARTKVEFLHRTVYEFLESGEMRPQIEAGTIPHVQSSQFNMSITLARLKFIENEVQSLCDAFSLIEHGVNHEINLNNDLDNELLAELETFALSSLQNTDTTATSRSMEVVLKALNSLFAVNRYDLATQILQSTKQIHEMRYYDSLLRGALGLTSSEGFKPVNMDLEFLETLISLDVDVNLRMIKPRSPWEQWLARWNSHKADLSPTGHPMEFPHFWKVTRVLIQHGANLNVTLPSGQSASEVFKYLVPPDDQNELAQLCPTLDDDWELVC